MKDLHSLSFDGVGTDGSRDGSAMDTSAQVNEDTEADCTVSINTGDKSSLSLTALCFAMRRTVCSQ